MTKPGGTGRPCIVIEARLAPFPPVRCTSLHGSSSNQSIEVSLIDNPHRSYWSCCSAYPLDRKHREFEITSRELVQVHQVFEMPVILVHHDHMCFPELFALKHGPDRWIKGRRIGTHQSHTF